MSLVVRQTGDPARTRGRLPLCIVVLLTALVAGCFSSEPVQLPPDQRFGHRYEGKWAPDGRLNLVIEPPEPEVDYFYYPAPYDSVVIRPAAFTREEGGQPYTRVEVLIKGAFPDTCTELHEVEQSRAANLLRLNVTMRRPKGAACMQARRSYRYYVMLDGIFRPGDYALQVNAVNYTFSLRVPSGG